MFRSLVVPLDGSALAERALPYAARLAEAGRGRLILVRVALPPTWAPLDAVDWTQLQAEAIEEAEEYIERIAAPLRSRMPITTRVASGRAAPVILEVVSDCAADGIVMATHGRTGLAHLVAGSVAEALLAHATEPVFLVHARPGEASPPTFNPAMARAMVPLDGSSFAENALHTAVDFVGTNGELVLVSVVEQPEHVQRDDSGRAIAYLDQQEESLTRDARAYLLDMRGRLLHEDPSLHVGIDVRVGAPAEGIISAAADRVADVVIMASHGRTGVRRALLGSVTGDVLREGTTPVLVVHPTRTGAPVVLVRPLTSTPSYVG
jgi:nucleotide-binding universal stress UspA family protein